MNARVIALMIVSIIAISGAYMIGEEHGKKILMAEKIGATLIINFDNYSWNYNISLEKGKSAYDLLLKAADEYNFSVITTYYSTYHSHFINSINGIEGGNGKYWQYWVNGKYANVGADAYMVSDGDVIEWKLAGYEGK